MKEWSSKQRLFSLFLLTFDFSYFQSVIFKQIKFYHPNKRASSLQLQPPEEEVSLGNVDQNGIKRADGL